MLANKRAEVRAQVIRPDDDGENTLPEGKVEVADREEPSGAPEPAGNRVMLDFDFFHTPSLF